MIKCACGVRAEELLGALTKRSRSERSWRHCRRLPAWVRSQRVRILTQEPAADCGLSQSSEDATSRSTKPQAPRNSRVRRLLGQSEKRSTNCRQKLRRDLNPIIDMMGHIVSKPDALNCKESRARSSRSESPRSTLHAAASLSTTDRRLPLSRGWQRQCGDDFGGEEDQWRGYLAEVCMRGVGVRIWRRVGSWRVDARSAAGLGTDPGTSRLTCPASVWASGAGSAGAGMPAVLRP